MRSNNKRLNLSIALSVFSGICAAQEQDPVFTLGMRGDLRWVGNANLAPRSEENINETQWRGTIFAVGELSNSWSSLSTDYQLQDRRYSEQENENETLLLGRANVLLGDRLDPAYLELSHSSEELPLEPGLADLPSNRDRRTISTASVYGNVGADSPTQFTVRATFADIQYDIRSLNEATRIGGGGTLIRRVSPISNLSLSYDQYDLDYRYSDQEFIYQGLAAKWGTSLRSLAYTLELGVNRMEQQGDDTMAPMLDVNLEYFTGVQNFRFSYSQYLSNTSQGSNNEVDFDNNRLGPDGGLDVIDQFQRQDLLVGWSHQRLCNGCRVGLEVGGIREDYENIVAESSNEIYLTLRAGYRFSPFWQTDISGRYNDVNFYEDDDGVQYFETRVEISLRRLQVARRGELRFYLGGVERNFELQSGYSSGYVGMSFDYKLYER